MFKVAKTINTSELSVEQKILLELARSEKPKTHYDLWKKDKVASSNTTVLSALHRLEHVSILESKQEETGRRRIFYNLTFAGLIVTLNIDEAWKYIDGIAENREEMLPLVFGKWKFFQEKKIKTRVIKRLRDKVSEYFVDPAKLDRLNLLAWRHETKQRDPERSIRARRREAIESIKAEPGLDDEAKDRVISQLSELQIFSPKGKLAHYMRGFDEAALALLDEEEERIKHDVTNGVFGLSTFPRAEELREYLSILKEDSEIAEYVQMEMIAIEKEYSRYLENIRSWNAWWEQL